MGALNGGAVVLADLIVRVSIDRASDEAVKLWALASAQYPADHGLVQDAATTTIIEVASAFALNARRALEILPPDRRFKLGQSRWDGTTDAVGERVGDFRDALNRIIHAQTLRVVFSTATPGHASLRDGALVVPWILAATDRRELASIDPFALAHAFLYEAFPVLLQGLRQRATARSTSAAKAKRKPASPRL